MTKLVIAALKLCVGDPDGKTRVLDCHALVDRAAEGLGEGVGVGADGTDPELFLELGAHTDDGVVEAAVAVCVVLDVPFVKDTARGRWAAR
jgi:hypothetical protein